MIARINRVIIQVWEIEDVKLSALYKPCALNQPGAPLPLRMEFPV